MKSYIVSLEKSDILIPTQLLKVSGLYGLVKIEAKRGEIKIVASRSFIKAIKPLNEAYILSLSSLSDWDTPEEDIAWAHLQ